MSGWGLPVRDLDLTDSVNGGWGAWEPRHAGFQHVGFQGVADGLQGLSTCSLRVSGFRVDWA